MKTKTAFSRFFGHAIFDGQKSVEFVLPKRRLKEKVDAPTEDPPFEVDAECKFTYKRKPTTNVWPEGISGFLTYEDVVAAYHVVNGIAHETGRNVRTRMRQEFFPALAEGIGTCIISFGLGYSAATRVAEEQLSLFTIYCDKSPKKFHHPLTVHFKMKKQLKNSRGKFVEAGSETPSIVEGKDIALVVRVVPRSGISDKSQPLVYCGGAYCSRHCCRMILPR